MQKNRFNKGAAFYALALFAIGVGQLVPLITGTRWNLATKYVFHCLSVGVVIVATGTLITQLYRMSKSAAWPQQFRRKREDPVQSHIMRFAEDLYRQQGYFNQGSFGAVNIALQYSVDEKDPLVEDAILALVEAGKLVPHGSNKGTVYALPAKRQLEMIKQHDLSRKWEERGGKYHPNHVLIGEIKRVESAVAAQKRQQVNS